MNRFDKKIYFFIGLFILLAALMAGLAIFPLIKMIKTESWELAHQKQLTNSFFENWEGLEKTKNDYEKINNELNSVTALLPSERIIDFIQTAENFALLTQNQQTIAILKSGASTEAKKTPSANGGVLNFQITLNGSFPNLIKFLACLENAPYYNDVSFLQISRPAQKTNSVAIDGQTLPNNITSVINLSVYQQNETANKQ